MTAVRVFVADDHPVVVQGIERFAAIVPELEVVGTAASADAIRAALDELRPDVVSLDVQMPGMKGTRTIEEITKRGAPILLFTLHAIDAAVAALVAAGARGYLSKSSSLDEYVRAVRVLRDGGTWFPDALERLLEGPAVKSPEELLTPRELEVFERLVECETPKEAAFTLGLSSSTVYTYTDRIRRKLGVRTQAELVRYAATWDLDTSR